MSVSPHLTSLPQPTGRDTLGSCVEKDAQGQQASASQSSAVSEMDAGRGSGHTHAHTHTHTHTRLLFTQGSETGRGCSPPPFPGIWPLSLSFHFSAILTINWFYLIFSEV